MKWIIIFLISINCFAEFRQTVTNPENGKNFVVVKYTELEITNWLEDNERSLWRYPNRCVFGLKDRWLKDEVAGYAATRFVQTDLENPLIGFTEYFYLKEYVINPIEDITVEIADIEAKKISDQAALNNLRSTMNSRTMTQQEITEWIKLKEGL